MDKKNIIKSKTFWLNLFVALMPLFSNHAAERIAEFTPQFTMLWGALNIALRYITKDKVVLLD